MAADKTQTSDTRDRDYMWLALSEASKGFGRTSPNPAVGVVIVKHDQVIATGFHHRAGGAHAELEALERAGDAARGAEVFVTLEPCCHEGQTHPCTCALIDAGVSRVVAGVVDPNPKVAGRGLNALREAGIEVVSGVLAAECEEANAPFFKFITTGKPYITVKYAMSLDGKIATRSGESRWISSKDSRRKVHDLRDRSDAVLIGAGTLRKDDPSLTTRDVPGGRDPVRVVLDTRGSIAFDAKVLTVASNAATWIVCGTEHADDLRARIEPPNDVLAFDVDDNGRLPMGALLTTLAQRGVVNLLVEGGGETIASLSEGGWIDRIVAFVAPKLVGGRSAPTPLDGLGVATMNQAATLSDVSVERIGDDLVITANVCPPADD
jgi:diaminohydroxyphosphoribosylaminopyrimidine deaminase/5-amino-6-(5-phosphoribosylamino)uracil reductase